MAGSSEQELAIRIAGKVENSLKQSLGMTEDGISHLAGMAKKAAVMITGAFAAIKVGQFIGDAVSEYSEFEQSMANTAGIAGATESEYEKLSKAAREAGKATTFTASEAADALGYMALAGWNVETSTKALTPVLKLAEATQADLATTSDQVTDSMSAMGVGIDELQEYLDVVVMTNNKANTTSAALMEAMIGCGGAARASGMDFKETATALGILANNGVKGAEAGTALNSMLVRISTKDAAKAAFKELGVAVYDNTGKMRDMRQILIDLNGAMSGLTEEEKNNYMAAIAGTNYYSKFGYLLDGVKEGVDGTASAWDALSDNLNNSEGALDEMDKKVTNTLKGAMARMGSAVSDLKISMIEAFGPHAIKIMDGFSNTIPKITENFVGMINKLPIDEFMTGVGNMTTGVMDFLVAVTGGEGDINSFSTMMEESFGIKLPDSVRSAIEVAQDFISKGQEVADFLIGTLESAVTGVAEKISENEPAIQSVIDLASDLKDRLFEAFDNAKPTITYIAETAIPNITDALLKVVGGAANVVDAFVEWDGFLPTITAIGAAVGAVKFYQLVTGIYSAAKAMTILNIAKAKDIAATIYINGLYAQDHILTGISIAKKYALIVSEKAHTVAQWASITATAAWNTVAGIGATVTSALGAAFAFLTSPIGLVILAIGAIIAIGVLLWKNWDTVKEKAGQLGSWLGEKFNAIKESVGNAIESFKNKFPVAFAFIEGVFNGWKATIDGVIGGVKQVFQGVIDFVQGVFTGNWSQALEGLKGIFSGAFGALSSLALAPLNAVKGVVVGALSAINVATNGKLSEIKSFFTTHLEGAKNTVVGILDGIKNAFSEKLEAAKNIVSGAVNAIKGFFNFKWELPKLKMPHFSIKGDFSLAPPKVPTMGVEWYKDGGIMTSPTMFGINGNSAMVGGEAGAEAILPLSDLWSKMGGFIDSAIGASVKLLAERIEDLQMGTNRVPLSTLSDRIATSGYEVEDAGRDNGAVSINYAPVYHFEGAAPTKDDIVQAEKESQSEFDKKMEQWLKRKRRTNF
ncbi:phage tail tape measure protein [Lachnoanaerobaculum saburreum]|uniref:Phage tail tape measure protein, TP901 family n=1 Tax=Lachnoanaerobaculum saburreum DSM 3986 TaxID=887325 RepID=E6LKB1_9FIRM|nr:phage tail tape measure protein [Lachnoanaerobaculum saburreum]EFU77751.1 phage tail tape measure protein, TP901 family [Lachnoanaerobaculum saburreum DSM 3986]